MSRDSKEIILGSAVVILGLFFWWFLKYVFYSASWRSGNLTASCWISGGVLFFLWGVSVCLVMLLIKNKFILFGSFGLTLLLFFIFFNNKPIYYLIASIILFGAFCFASNRIKKEEEVQVNLNFWRIWKRGLPILITVFCLLISLIYYFSPEIMHAKEIKIKIPEKIFNVVIKPIEGLIKEKLPEGIDLDSQISKFLPSDQIKELEKQFGIKVGKTDIGRDVLYKLVDYQLNNITGPYKEFIPLGLAIGLFITLKIASLIYMPIVILFSYLVLKLLLVVKFVKFEKETREVETVKL